MDEATFLASDATDQELLSRDAELNASKYYNIGYKKGIFESRTVHLQQGFDDGFLAGAQTSFAEQVNRIISPGESLSFERIRTLLADKIQPSECKN